MHPKIDEIKVFLENSKYFKTIKNIELFATKMYEAYPGRDLIRELKKMEFWLVGNPTREKKNYGRFITNWLNKE